MNRRMIIGRVLAAIMALACAVGLGDLVYRAIP
jgi:hypothetical protein